MNDVEVTALYFVIDPADIFPKDPDENEEKAHENEYHIHEQFIEVIIHIVDQYIGDHVDHEAQSDEYADNPQEQTYPQGDP